MTPASAMGADATIGYLAAHLDKTVNGTVVGVLGGVDYATPAVIEAKPNGHVTVASAANRPTLAYVGARDGMLHAFCVAPEAGATQCYGSYPVGSEIWAFIPPGVKAQMDAARLAGDWSRVNIGGALRVADMQDAFGGSASPVYRTVLIGATRDSGHVFALDISNPNPANANQPGFQLLWEQDGTRTSAGVTAYRMGPTAGATLALPGGVQGVAVVTSATDSSSTAPGVNTYVLRLSDGKVVGVNQQLYARKIALGGGGSAAMPGSDVPPMATVLDADSNGSDESVFVATLTGYVQKFRLVAGGFDAGTPPFALFDTAAQGRCAAGITCQPLGASPTVGRRGASSALTVFVATGGADWVRSATAQSYAFGLDATATAAVDPVWSSTLGTVQNPVRPGNVTPLNMPVRAYAQLTVAGTDLYGAATTLAINSFDQLATPSMYPGTYGQLDRWSNLNTAIDGTATALITQGTNFSAGLGNVLETNTTAADGRLTFLGPNGLMRTALGVNSTSLRNLSYAVNASNAGSHNFTQIGWFDLSN
jgi:hypothetical protein